MPRRRSADATDASLTEACGSVQRAVALSSNTRRHHQQQQQQQQKAAPKSPQEGDIPYVNRADVMVAAATAAGAAGASKEACQSLLRALALGKGAARPLTLPGASRPRRNSVTGGAMTALHGLLAVDTVAESAEDDGADGAAAEGVDASTSVQEKEVDEEPQQPQQMQRRPSPQSPAFSPLPVEAVGRFVAPYGQQLLRAPAALAAAAGAGAPSPIAGAPATAGASNSANSGSPAASEGSGALRSVLTRGSLRSAGSGSTGR